MFIDDRVLPVKAATQINKFIFKTSLFPFSFTIQILNPKSYILHKTSLFPFKPFKCTSNLV